MMATSEVHGLALILGARPRQVNERMRRSLRVYRLRPSLTNLP